MDMNKELVARAFSKAGEEPITAEEWAEETPNNRVRTVKTFYLPTILEALSSFDWTSQKKRASLVLSDVSNLSNFRFVYSLPLDCARCIELGNKGEYLVEGNLLYTDEENAILLYITNYHKTPEVQEESESDDVTEQESETESTEETDEITDEYDLYNTPILDPVLSEYIECKLAAKIALKLTADKEKYQMLYSEAQLIANNAMKKSAEMARNKSKGNVTWLEQLGLEG